MTASVSLLKTSRLAPGMITPRQDASIPSAIPERQQQETICATCQRTLPDLLLKRRYMHDHQSSLRALLTSSESGCRFCTVFYHNFAYTNYKDTSLDDGRVVIGRSSREESFKVMLRGTDNEVTYGAEIPFHIERGEQQEFDQRSIRTKGCIAKAADDAENVELVKAMIEDCLRNHPICASARVGNDMPTRLLDVSPSKSDAQVVKIVPGSDARRFGGRYVCLSHCWGLVPELAPWKLTGSRTHAYMTEISMEILPLTFRQAIIYTRSLGEKYLWIDSLCIVQDSAKDWATEASRMATIYTNGLVTISAASDSSLVGCILQRESKVVEPAILDLDPGHQNGRRAYIFHSVPNELRLRSNVPVAKRAWCLQERKLSMRVVQFTSYQWLWTCKTATTSERILRKLAITAHNLGTAGKADLNFYDQKDTGTRLTRGDGVVSDEVEVKQYKESRKDYEEWYKTVQDFTQCDITYPTDRLPAIAGLAQRQQSRVPDNYLAGLWENDFWDGLIWYSNYCPKARPSVYIAPSWSWACLDNAVTFDGFLRYKDEFSPILISASIQHSSVDAMGMIQGGHLRLKGYLKSVTTKPIVVGYRVPGSSGYVSLSADTPYERTSREIDNGMGTVRLDTDQDAENCDTLMCLAVLEGRAIALKCINVEGSEVPAYMRVGSLKCVPFMFKGAEEVIFDLY